MRIVRLVRTFSGRLSRRFADNGLEVSSNMPLDLATLLSQPLVAFTIELDNEYAHRSAHRTTLQRRTGAPNRGPWLTSFAMYANCLQFLGEAPMPVRELERLARSSTNLDGMRRWGYIKLSPPPDRPNSKRPNEGWLMELTPAGRMSQESWRPLPQLVEQRWRDRFGTGRSQFSSCCSCGSQSGAGPGISGFHANSHVWPLHPRPRPARRAAHATRQRGSAKHRLAAHRPAVPSALRLRLRV